MAHGIKYNPVEPSAEMKAALCAFMGWPRTEVKVTRGRGCKGGSLELWIKPLERLVNACNNPEIDAMQARIAAWMVERGYDWSGNVARQNMLATKPHTCFNGGYGLSVARIEVVELAAGKASIEVRG